MKTISITRTVLFGEPPQKFAVSFAVGSRFVRIQGPGRGGMKAEHVMEWKGAAFRPGCLAMTEQAVAFFLEVEAGAVPDDRVELGNQELMIAGRLPTKAPGRVDYHERQLPRSDRQGVG